MWAAFDFVEALKPGVRYSISHRNTVELDVAIAIIIAVDAPEERSIREALAAWCATPLKGMTPEKGDERLISSSVVQGVSFCGFNI